METVFIKMADDQTTQKTAVHVHAMEGPRLLQCTEPDCFALPVQSCFAQDRGWKFTTTVKKTLREHIKCHNKYRGSKAKLVALASKVTRTQQSTFTCACGFDGKLTKLLKHICRDDHPGRIIKSVAKRAAKATKSPRKKSMRRTATSFAQALPKADGSDELVIRLNAEEEQTAEGIMDACLAGQQNLGSPFLRLLSPASQAGRVKPLCRRPMALRVGDFIRRAATNSYWCVKKLHLKDRMQVQQFMPYKCKMHKGECWRILRKQGKPVCVSVRRAKLLRGGPLLYPRLDRRSPTLAKRCFAKEDWPKEADPRPLSALETFLKNCDQMEGQHNAITQTIFEALAVMTLQHADVPTICPHADAETPEACNIIRRGCRSSGCVVTSQGIFLAQKQMYSCSVHNAKWQFAVRPDSPLETDAISGHMLGDYAIDKSFWPKAWRLFRETEDWTMIERDLRATTADRFSWELSRRPDANALAPEQQKALHDSLMQASQRKNLMEHIIEC